MKTWNIGNTTVRNPQRLREALQLFKITMDGRSFGRVEQQEYLNELVRSNLVDSARNTEGDDGGRKFASAFKQLGFVTNWSRGQSWNMTGVGTLLVEHPELEETIFLRQLLKYQIPSPLENGSTVRGFRVRPFRLLLRFLKRAYDEQLVGLTKFEIGLYVITLLTEDDAPFEAAFTNIKAFRIAYDSLTGLVAKKRFAFERLRKVAQSLRLVRDTLLDYADSTSRYALMSGLLTIRGNKLAISEARLPFVQAILTDGSDLISESAYLGIFYDAELPSLPTDNLVFIRTQITSLERQLTNLTMQTGETVIVPVVPLEATLSMLQGHEIELRKLLRQVREVQFYHTQRTQVALAEIEELLESIKEGTLIGRDVYAPAYFEWAIWRLFLAINDLVGPISKTRGFNIDDDIHPIHHAQGGAADLTFTYDDFKLVCEMTLTSGSRQFAAEGEPVTRHVFSEREKSGDKPVYGLFVARKLDPNTADAFHHARYWRNRKQHVDTPVVALEIEQIIALVQRIRQQPVTSTAIRELLDSILQMQDTYLYGPDWYEAYSELYEQWISTSGSNA
ncbi:MAG: AlwI family type II restriction endonuclease [Ktedonobacteraceae bacterium]